jgi:hypothetical protein
MTDTTPLTPLPRPRLVHPAKENSMHAQGQTPTKAIAPDDTEGLTRFAYRYPVHVYKILPTDFWNGWSRARDVVKVDFSPRFDASARAVSATAWEYQWAAAKIGAHRLGWKGDIRGYPGDEENLFVSGLPDGRYSGGGFMIAWKQESYGTTFIASPTPLPWLLDDEDSDYTAVVVKDEVS